MSTANRGWLAGLTFGFLTTLLALAGEPATTQPVEKNPLYHKRFLEDIKKMNGDVTLVFIGDSITDFWRQGSDFMRGQGGGKAIWEKYFEPYKALNLGLAGDRTENVLWRLRNGELDGYKAKLFVVMIGTNNNAGPADSAPNVAAGIEAIIKEITGKQPQAKILLLGIFPRAEPNHAVRRKNDEVNKLIEKFDDKKTVFYLDIGDKFLDKDRVIAKDLMPDGLHPSAKGYQVWADAIDTMVKTLLGAKP
ncbi:MAG: GDSL-type esterase/lipase family protein [Planctomycetota bacterium]|nr:GDSL-type esterase/lipase family protein [Planctomycetota bacterium]